MVMFHNFSGAKPAIKLDMRVIFRGNAHWTGPALVTVKHIYTEYLSRESVALVGE